MRENRTCGSEGGEAQSLPYPYPCAHAGEWRAELGSAGGKLASLPITPS